MKAYTPFYFIHFVSIADTSLLEVFSSKIFFLVPGGRTQPAVLPGPGDSVQALRAARAHILLLTPPRPSALHTILQGLHEGIHNASQKTSARSARARSAAKTHEYYIEANSPKYSVVCNH
jgi:hypothetical protein